MPIEMCQFTRVPMTRLNVSFVLQSFSQCRIPRLQILKRSIRETGACLMRGSNSEPPKIRRTSQQYYTEEFKGNPQLGSIMTEICVAILRWKFSQAAAWLGVYISRKISTSNNTIFEFRHFCTIDIRDGWSRQQSHCHAFTCLTCSHIYIYIIYIYTYMYIWFKVVFNHGLVDKYIKFPHIWNDLITRLFSRK